MLLMNWYSINCSVYSLRLVKCGGDIFILSTIKCLIISLLAIFSFSHKAYTQASDVLIPYRKGEWWGYCNSQKKIIIPCQYEETTPFVGELAKVKSKGKWGLIDREGKLFVPCAYDLIFGSQKKELIIVCQGGDKGGVGGRWAWVFGYQGDTISLEYDLIRETEIDDLLAVKKNNYWGFINLRGTFIIPLTYQIPTQSEQWHTENAHNPEAILNILQNETATHHSPHFYQGYIKLRKNGLWGLLNRYGNPILPFGYDWIGEANEGWINVSKNGKFIYQNLDNQSIMPFSYDIAYPFSEGVAVVGTRSDLPQIHWQVIDKKGKVIFKIPESYQLLDYKFRNGCLRVRHQNREFWLTNRGKTLGSFSHLKPFVYYWALAVQNQKSGLVNYKAKTLVPFIYDINENNEPNAQILRDLVKLRRNGKWGILGVKNQQLIDFQYDELIFPVEWDYYAAPYAALFAAQKNGKWGFLSLRERVVIPFKYDKVGIFEGSLAKVRYQNRLGYIDRDGNEYWDD